MMVFELEKMKRNTIGTLNSECHDHIDMVVRCRASQRDTLVVRLGGVSKIVVQESLGRKYGFPEGLCNKEEDS
jgi:hypothetical protein